MSSPDGLSVPFVILSSPMLFAYEYRTCTRMSSMEFGVCSQSFDGMCQEARVEAPYLLYEYGVLRMRVRMGSSRMGQSWLFAKGTG